MAPPSAVKSEDLTRGSQLVGCSLPRYGRVIWDRYRTYMAMDTAAAPGRHITFEACFNFRDLGGYPAAGGTVRWGHLFRADGIHRLTTADREQFSRLGIVTVIDLRTPEEADSRGRIGEFGGRYHHFPMFDVLPDLAAFGPAEAASDSFVADRYREMLAEGATRLTATLTVLAEPDSLPAVFHCSAGKDRTGIVAAVVLRVLGVPVADVAADYALSQAAMVRLRAWVEANAPDGAATLARIPEAMLGAEAHTMIRLLAALESEYGSVAGYLASIGLDEAVIPRLRHALLE